MSCQWLLVGRLGPRCCFTETPVIITCHIIIYTYHRRIYWRPQELSSAAVCHRCTWSDAPHALVAFPSPHFSSRAHRHPIVCFPGLLSSNPAHSPHRLHVLLKFLFPFTPTIMNGSDPNRPRYRGANLASFPQTSSTVPDTGTRPGPYTDHLSSITRSPFSAGAYPTQPESSWLYGNQDPQEVLVFIDIDMHQLIVEYLTSYVHPPSPKTCGNWDSLSLRHSPVQPPVTQYKIPRSPRCFPLSSSPLGSMAIKTHNRC
jgi:hypothetical protein